MIIIVDFNSLFNQSNWLTINSYGFTPESHGVKKKATPKTIFGIKKKIREVTHTYNNQPLIEKIMTREEMLKKLAEMNKNIKGTASDKDMDLMRKSIPDTTKEIDLKFIAERTGAAVSEEELLKLKALLGKK